MLYITLHAMYYIMYYVLRCVIKTQLFMSILFGTIGMAAGQDRGLPEPAQSFRFWTRIRGEQHGDDCGGSRRHRMNRPVRWLIETLVEPAFNDPRIALEWLIGFLPTINMLMGRVVEIISAMKVFRSIIEPIHVHHSLISLTTTRCECVM